MNHLLNYSGKSGRQKVLCQFKQTGFQVLGFHELAAIKNIMVLAFYKVAALVLKVFSKPFIEHTKKVHLRGNAQSQSPRMRKFFTLFGNKFNYYEQIINQKFLKIESAYAYKPLNDDLAIEKGINLFYEILFYLLMLGIPIYEMNRSSKESKEKSKRLQEVLKKVEKRFSRVAGEVERQKQVIMQQRTIVHALPKNDGSKTTDPAYKICLQFPNRRTHIYHIDFLL